MATTTATQIQQLYVGLLGRAADQGGLNWWADQVTTGGKTLEDVRASFVTSTEYTTTYGAAATRADLVTSIYQNLFERTPSADEVKYWAETDTRPADQLVAAFIEFAGAADQAVINNKTFVAQTYTDTVGADFNKAAAAEVIANVDGTSASVTAALTAINSGTLEGQVPGVNQIEALAAAQAAVTAFEEANTAAADALVAKLAAHVDAEGKSVISDTDGIDADSSYQDKVNAVVEDATAFRDLIGDATNILEGEAQLAATQVNNQYALLSKTDKALADTLVRAIAAETTAKTGVATPVEKATAIAGLGADKTAEAGLKELGGYLSPDIAKIVYEAYVNGSDGTDVRSEIDAALKGSDTYAAFKASAVKDAAYADAQVATADAQGELPASGNAYIAALVEKTTADATVADAKVADADVAAATELKDAYAVQTGALADAENAVKAVNVAGKVAIHELTASTTGTDATPIKDVFYFGDKAVAANDFSITKFAAGDSIVLGDNSYTFNSGALSTGDNNTLEFFLVQAGKDLQVVLETANYGSSDVKTNATTGAVINNNDDHAAVITLTGVALADVTVNNGIISHVA